MDRYTYEREALAAGYGLVCGCDEAGAGPLAGPVYAAAVILPLGLDVPGLDDSKKLTAKKRESLFPFIDGNRDRGRTSSITVPHRCIVKGDSLSASVAAASVLAKVSRDRFMLEMAERYPQYRFDQHKGYGTKLHYELLRRYGPSPIHRRTFLKSL